MAKYILVPDSFKGTMSSVEVCEIMARAILKLDPTAEVVSIPVADGGEGTVEAFLAAIHGERIEATVSNPFFEKMKTVYGVIGEGKTAVIEMAACAGLPLVGDRPDPERATTYGVGELIMDSVQRGAKKIILGLGGSATNDGGCGAAAACGVRFFDDKGEVFVPTGGTLHKIARIEKTSHPELHKIEIDAMCDIDNPMFGENGAAYIFGPQKGADAEIVRTLDDGLRHLSKMITRDLGCDVSALPGGGAAGAMGAGMAAFFGAKLKMGIDVVLEAAHFEDRLRGAKIVFTGEGRIDAQSMRGKVVVGVARRAVKHGVPVVAVVGQIGEGAEAAYSEGVTSIFSINTAPLPFSEAKHHSKENLGITMQNILRLMLRT